MHFALDASPLLRDERVLALVLFAEPGGDEPRRELHASDVPGSMAADLVHLQVEF